MATSYPTISPNATDVNNGTLVGAATPHAACSDASNASYVQLAAGQHLHFQLANYTVAGTQFCNRWRLFVRAALVTAAPAQTLTARLVSNGTNDSWPNPIILSNTITDYYGPWLQVPGYWITQADINNLVVHFVDGTQDSVGIRIYEASVQLEIRDLPTLSAMSVLNAGGGMGGSVYFTYADGWYNMPEYTHLLVYTAADVGTAGFAPGKAGFTPVWDTGVIRNPPATPTSTGADFVLGVLGLKNGVTYYFYLMAGITTFQLRDLNTGWKLVTAGGTTVFATEPFPPMITLTDDTANHRVSIALQGQNNLLDTLMAAFTDTAIGSAWSLTANTAAAAGNSSPTPQSSGNTYWTSLTRTGSTGTASCQTIQTGQAALRVNANMQYLAMVWTRAATVVRSFDIKINWYDSTGAAISTSTSTGTNDSTSAWQQKTYLVTSPNNAVYARLSFEFLNVPVGELHYLNMASFGPSPSSEPTTAWRGPGHACNNVMNYGMADGDFSTWAAVTNCSLTSETTNFRDGTVAVKVTRTATGVCTASLLFDQPLVNYSDVEGNFTYPYPQFDMTETPDQIRAFAYVRPATVTKNCKIQLQFYTGAVPTGALYEGPLVSCASASYTKVEYIVDTPRDFVWDTVLIYVWIDTGSAAEVFAVDSASLSWYTADAVWEYGGYHQTSPPMFGYFEVQAREGTTGAWTDLAGDMKQLAKVWGTVQQGTVYDYVARRDGTTVMYYRARYHSNGYWSDWSTVSYTITPAMPTAGRWVIIDPYSSPVVTLELDVLGDSFHYDLPEDTATFHPLNRDRDIITFDQARGAEMTLTFDFVNPTDWANFQALRLRQRKALLLRREYTGEQWWIRFQGKFSVDEQVTNPVRRLVSVDMVEIDVPTDY